MKKYFRFRDFEWSYFLKFGLNEELTALEVNLGVFLKDGDIFKKFATFGRKENTFFPTQKKSLFLTQIAVHVHGGTVKNSKNTQNPRIPDLGFFGAGVPNPRSKL